MADSGVRWFTRDETAVSNVIGVILLIAITVTLAGVFTGFFFGFGDSVESVSPKFTSTSEYDNSMTGNGERLVIEHQTGESVDPAYLTVIVREARWEDTTAGTSGKAEYTGTVFENQISNEYSASKTVELNRSHFQKSGGGSLTGDTYLDLSGATVLIRWEDPDPDKKRTDLVYRCEVTVSDGCEGV